jgi:hypothetical protein
VETNFLGISGKYFLIWCRNLSVERYSVVVKFCRRQGSTSVSNLERFKCPRKDGTLSRSDGLNEKSTRETPFSLFPSIFLETTSLNSKQRSGILASQFEPFLEISTFLRRVLYDPEGLSN